MSGAVFKLHKETIPEELEFVPAELVEFVLPAHFIERQVMFYLILKCFPGVHCNSRDGRYAERRRVPLPEPVPKARPG